MEQNRKEGRENKDLKKKGTGLGKGKGGKSAE